MSILDLHADAAVDAAVSAPKVAPEPAAPKFSAWSAIPRGLAVAAGEIGATLSDAAGAMDYMRRAERLPRSGLPPEALSSEMGDTVRSYWKEYKPDPQTAGVAEQVLFGAARGMSKVALGAMIGGAPGIVAAGAEEMVTVSDDLRLQGVDMQTRTQAGLVQGGGLAMAALPLLGSTLAQTAGLYVLGGPGGFMAQQALTREILRSGGYDQLAEQYDPLDPVGLAVSAVVPAVFAGVGIRGQRIEARRAADAALVAGPLPSEPVPVAAAARQVFAPEVQDAARVVFGAEQRAASNPGADTLRTADAHEAALTRAEEQMAAGERVSVNDVAPGRVIESLESFLAREKIKPEATPPEVRGNFLAWVRDRGGIDMGQKYDITGETSGVLSNPGGIFRKGGRGPDDLALMAAEEGYLLPGTGGDSKAFVELVQQAINGERILKLDEQGAAAARAAQMADSDARLAAVEARLQLLGVDTLPAKGNVAALEAYAAANEPRLLAAALAEMQAARVDDSPEFDGMAARARLIADDVLDGGRTLPEYEAEFGALSPVMRRLVGDALAKDAAAPVQADSGRAAPAPEAAAPPRAETPGATPGATAEAQAAAARVAEVQAQYPDLQVMLDGMDAPMPMREFLAAVKAEADEMTADAPLYEVAASCALLNGP